MAWGLQPNFAVLDVMSSCGAPKTAFVSPIRLWSPIALTSELAEELEKLGEVRCLVAPNKLHHLFLTEWAERYPGARLHAAPGLAKKRPDLTFSAELGDGSPPEWQSEIDQVVIGGSFVMNEVVLFHAHRGAHSCVT